MQCNSAICHSAVLCIGWKCSAEGASMTSAESGRQNNLLSLTATSTEQKKVDLDFFRYILDKKWVSCTEICSMSESVGGFCFIFLPLFRHILTYLGISLTHVWVAWDAILPNTFKDSCLLQYSCELLYILSQRYFWISGNIFETFMWVALHFPKKYLSIWNKICVSQRYVCISRRISLRYLCELQR